MQGQPHKPFYSCSYRSDIAKDMLYIGVAIFVITLALFLIAKDISKIVQAMYMIDKLY